MRVPQGVLRCGSESRRMLNDLLGAVGKALLRTNVLTVCLLAFGVAVSGETSQKRPGPPGNLRKTHRVSRSKPPTPVLALEPPVAIPQLPQSPPPPQTPEKMPPGVPQVSWDGKQLTINSDNSTLSDILVAIRTRTGAELEIPANASRERVAARLGPGPAREVIATLLSWTEFDYVIQASDTDPARIRSVLLIPRSKSEAVSNAGPGVEARAESRSAYRRYVRPSPSGAEGPAPENPAPPQSEASAELPAPADAQPAPATAAAHPAPTEIQPATADSQSTSADAQTAPSEPKPSPATPEPDLNQPPANPSEQRIQQLQNMYEQRKQMIQDARKPPAN